MADHTPQTPRRGDLLNETKQPAQQHPEEWKNDLNPDGGAGVNYGQVGPHPERDARTVYDLKEIHNQLLLTDDQLKEIPVLPPGSRLEQGATYIDLKDSERREFTAMGGMEAGPDNWYVPKTNVDYQLWNRLIGVTNKERLGEASEE